MEVGFRVELAFDVGLEEKDELSSIELIVGSRLPLNTGRGDWLSCADGSIEISLFVTGASVGTFPFELATFSTYETSTTSEPSSCTTPSSIAFVIAEEYAVSRLEAYS